VTGSEPPTAKTATANLSITMTSKIQHVVVMFEENRTPDNLFRGPIL
jgi:phospholipase C